MSANTMNYGVSDGGWYRDRTYDIRLVRATVPKVINDLARESRLETALFGVGRGTNGAHGC